MADSESVSPTAADSAYRDCRKLIPLASKAEVQRLLKDILQPFANKVDIIQSGLLDALISRGVITDIDNESLHALHHPTRSERARHLWKILYSIDHVVFVRDALPVICEKYGYIIPDEFWKNASLGADARDGGESAGDGGTECIRCAIVNRVRPPLLADFLFRIGMIGFRTHTELTSTGCTCKTDWNKIFSAFSCLQRFSASRHQKEMEQILSGHSLRVPIDLLLQMMNGFPCKCPLKTREPGKNTLWARRLRLSFRDLVIRRPSQDSTWSQDSSVYPQSESTGVESDAASLQSDTTVLQASVATHTHNSQHLPALSARDLGRWRHIHMSMRRSHTNRQSILTALCDGLFAQTPDGQPHSPDVSENRNASENCAKVCEPTVSVTRAVTHQTQTTGQASAEPVPRHHFRTFPRESAKAKHQHLSLDLGRTSESQISSRFAGLQTLDRQEESQRISEDDHVGYENTAISEKRRQDLTSEAKLGASGVSITQQCCNQKRSDELTGDSDKAHSAHNSKCLRQRDDSGECSPHSDCLPDLGPQHSLDPDFEQNFDLEAMCPCTDAGQTHFSDLEAAKQENDVKDLCQFAACDVTSAQDLDILLKKAVVVDADARGKLRKLIQDYAELETDFTGIRERTEALRTTPKPQEASEGQMAVQNLEEVAVDIVSLCENMLVQKRAFILCTIYLSTIPRLQEEQTAEKTQQIAGCLLLLVEAAMFELSQKVHTLAESQENSGTRCTCLGELGTSINKFLSGF